MATTSAWFNIHDVSVAVQPDGKLVVATNTTTYTYQSATKKTSASYTITSSNMLVIRLNTDGSLDPTFGNGGKAVVKIPNAFEVATGVAVLSTGQIVVAGGRLNGTYAGPEFTVARLTSSGTLDTTFGPNGQGYNDLDVATAGSTLHGVMSMGVDASGNILVGGNYFPSGAPAAHFEVVRYTPAGLIDKSFANQGIFDLANPGTGAQVGVNTVSFQPDGHIILGIGGSHAGALRLNTNGTIDTTFGSSGYFVAPHYSLHVAVAVQPDGKVLVDQNYFDASGNYAGFDVYQLLPGGTLAPAFGSGGTAVIVQPDEVLPVGLVVGPDGKITGDELAEANSGNGTAVIGVFRLQNDLTSNMAALVAKAPGGGAGSLYFIPTDLLGSALDGVDIPAGPLARKANRPKA